MTTCSGWLRRRTACRETNGHLALQMLNRRRQFQPTLDNRVGLILTV